MTTERMPPPKSGKTLTPRQIECLKCWIDEGGAWSRHWAFEPARPRPRRIPPIDPGRETRSTRSCWPGSGRRAQTRPRGSATTLIRRVTLDLTGLPPTPAEVDAFLADSSPDAYKRVVDRLLHSPRFGERMASRWLDAARYADTNGYQSDGERIMWRWRDWVIAAYNRNMPFDQFTIEQIAGDLLPGPPSTS